MAKKCMVSFVLLLLVMILLYAQSADTVPQSAEQNLNQFAGIWRAHAESDSGANFYELLFYNDYTCLLEFSLPLTGSDTDCNITARGTYSYTSTTLSISVSYTDTDGKTADSTWNTQFTFNERFNSLKITVPLPGNSEPVTLLFIKTASLAIEDTNSNL